MDVKDALQELALAVKRIVNERIEAKGYNTRAKKNTLVGSNLQKSLNVVPTEDGIVLQIADYWEFIVRGWIRTGNYPGTMRQFVKNINDWVKRKGIVANGLTQNQLVWAIVNKIFDYGIHYRPFMVYDEDGDLSKMIPELNAYMDKWFDTLFDAIMNKIDNYFNK